MQAIIGGAQRWYLVAAMLLALALTGPQPAWAQPQATGLNVIAVFYTVDGDRCDGGFRAVGNGKWEQHDGSGAFEQSFIEVARYESAVTLTDPQRGTYVELDLLTREVKVAQAKGEMWDRFYPIIASQAGAVDHPDAVATSGKSGGTAVNGLTANEIVLTNDGVTSAETLRHRGDGVWIVLDRRGSQTGQYVERSRGAEQIVLRNDALGIEVTIDFTTMTVNAGYVGASTPTETYRILSASTVASAVSPAPAPGPAVPAVNGLNASEIVGTEDGVTPIVTLRHEGNGVWSEVRENNAKGVQLVERLRNAQQIVLDYEPERMEIVIDFTTMTMTVGVVGGGPLATYRILSASEVASTTSAPGPAPVPAPATGEVNGMTVTQVYFTGDGATELGSFVALGGGKWVERDLNRKTVFHFVETQRDQWSVFLTDRSRGVEIQLDLYTKQVLYGPIGQQRWPLYLILYAL